MPITGDHTHAANHAAGIRSRLLALAVALLPAAHVFITSTMAPSTYGFGGYAVYDAKRLLELTLLPLMFVIMLADGGLRAALGRRIRQTPGWLGLAVLAFFGLGVVSAFVNGDSGVGLAASLADVGLLALVVAAVPCIAACRDVAGSAFDRLACGFLILLPLVVGVQELLGVFAVRNAGLEFGFYISLPNFHFPRFYNQMQSWMLPATVAAVLVFPGRRLVTVLVVVALALHWYVVLATGARGTMVGVGLATILCIALVPRARWLILRYQAAGLGAGLAIFLALAATAPSASPDSPASTGASGNVMDTSSFHGDRLTGALGGERMRSSSGRTAMWRDSLRDARRHPVLGIGPGNYACGGWKTRGAHPHSFPMQILGEWGVPAFLLLLGIGGYLAAGAVVNARRVSPRATVPGTQPETSTMVSGVLLCAVAAAAVHACLSGVLLMPASQLTGVLVSGWLLGARSASGTGITSTFLRTGTVFALIALAGALALAGWGWRDHAYREQAYAHSPNWDLAFPRFWHNGKVCPAPEPAATSGKGDNRSDS